MYGNMFDADHRKSSEKKDFFLMSILKFALKEIQNVIHFVLQLILHPQKNWRNLYKPITRRKAFAWLMITLVTVNYFMPFVPLPNIGKQDMLFPATLEKVGTGAWRYLKDPDVLPDEEPQVLASVDVDVDLKENKNAKKEAAKGRESYRWDVKLPNGTVFSFGKQSEDGILPVVKIMNKDGWFVRYYPDSNLKSVKPKVDKNVIQWEIASGITARYTMQQDRVKADYIVDNRSSLCHSRLDPESIEILNRVQDDKGKCSSNKLDFIVEFDQKLTHESMPQGDISWLNEINQEIFNFPAPFVIDADSKKFDGEFEIKKQGAGKSLLSIVLPQDKLEEAAFPITIDPIAIDTSAAATGTAYGNGRRVLKDQYGNIIVLCDCGNTHDNVYYRPYSSGSFTDAAIDLDGDNASGASLEISADFNSSGNVEVAFRYSTIGIRYVRLTVTRDGSNLITGISKGTVLAIDSTGSTLANRPSLIVANKGEGSGVEKIAVAWAMNTTASTARGEVRFMQCDVADDCTVDDNWKNASEEINANGTCNDTATSGDAGIPNAFNCKGAADKLFAYTAAHTRHHVVLTQMPGPSKRSPEAAKFYDGATYSNLTDTIDGNTGTSDVIQPDITDDFIYIGDSDTFSKISVDISVSGDCVFLACVFSMEYYDGSTWSSISNFVDNATSGSDIFKEDGSLLFDEPSNWATTSVDSVTKYWVRIKTNTNGPTVAPEVAEFYITDRNSKALLIVAGTDATDDLGSAYVPWDEVGNTGWENNSSNLSIGVPWRSTVDSLHTTGGNWTDRTMYPLSGTVDYINNRAYIAYTDCNGGSCGTSSVATIESIQNNKDLIVAGNWTDAAFPAVTEAVDINFSLASDGQDVYLFYVLDPGTNGLVYRKCTPSGGGLGNICDNASDWGSETTVVSGTDISHPNAVVSKATADSAAIDMVYTMPTALDVMYERHYANLVSNTTQVAANGDDATHRDCVSGTDDADIATSVPLVGFFLADSSCDSSVDAKYHRAFRFPALAVAQGAAISSAYVEFRVSARSGTNTIDFTIAGEDVDDSAAFTASANCADPCSGAVRTRYDNSATTSTYDYTSGNAMHFSEYTYRFDVTNIVQEIVCRGASAVQPCVGNFNGAGNWASGNDLTIMLISSETDAARNTITVNSFSQGADFKVRLQVNLGTTGKNYSMGVVTPPSGSGSYTDLDHPFSPIEFGSVVSDDNLYASTSANMVLAANTSAAPIIQFKENNTGNNNTYKITTSVIAKSSVSTASKNVYLQVYRGGSTNDWVTMDTESSAVGDTEFTLSGELTSNLSDYYFSETPGSETCDSSSTNCWSYWRVYQAANSSSGVNQVLYVDQASITYEANGPSKVAYTTSARTVAGSACNGSANVITIQLQNPSNVATVPTGTTVIRMSSDSSNETFYTDSSCTTVATNGDYTFTTSDHTKNVYIVDNSTSANSYTLSATKQSGPDTISSADQAFNVFKQETEVRGGIQFQGGISL